MNRIIYETNKFNKNKKNWTNKGQNDILFIEIGHK